MQSPQYSVAKRPRALPAFPRPKSERFDEGATAHSLELLPRDVYLYNNVPTEGVGSLSLVFLYLCALFIK